MSIVSSTIAIHSMDIGTPNITEFYLLQKAMDTQIGVMNAVRSAPTERGITRPSTGLRHLDPDTDFKVKRITTRFNEALYLAANEPSLGLYRIQEHVSRTLPLLVERKIGLKENHKKIKDAVFDLDLSIDVVETMSKLTNFTRIQAALETAIEVKGKLNILHEQEKSRLELNAIKAQQANRSLSQNEPAEGYICPVCYFAHTNQDDLIAHWQREHNLDKYENDVFHEIELPLNKLDHSAHTNSDNAEDTVKKEDGAKTMIGRSKVRYLSECEDVVKSIEGEIVDPSKKIQQEKQLQTQEGDVQDALSLEKDEGLYRKFCNNTEEGEQSRNSSSNSCALSPDLLKTFEINEQIRVSEANESTASEGSDP